MGHQTSVIGSGGQISTDTSQGTISSRVVILSKPAYFETVAEFPFDNVKEIKSAISMDMLSYAPFSTDLFLLRRIGRRDEKTRVNIWFIRPEFVQRLDQVSPWFVFPETALLQLNAQFFNDFFIIPHPEGFLLTHIDHRAVRSLLTQNDGPDLILFLRSIGKDFGNTERFRFENFDLYLSCLWEAIQNASLSDMLPFLKLALSVHSSQADNRIVRWGAIAMGLIAIVYTGIWVGMPLYANRQLLHENETVSAGLADIIDKQARLDKTIEQINVMDQVVKDYAPRLILLNLLYDVLPSDTILTQLTVAGGQVEIRGSAQQASAVLSSLTAAPGIEHAQFSAPLRKDTKTSRDLFTVSFGFTSPSTDAAAAYAPRRVITFH